MRSWFLMCLLSAVTHSSFAQQSPHGDIKTACSECHSTDSWKMRADATFSHAGTGFALEGQHRAVPCTSCHVGMKFASISTKCSTCHTDAHLGELGTDCARCHSPNAWNIADTRLLHDQTRFPLLGAHITAACNDCHTGAAGRRYRGLPIACASCHQSDYRRTKNPDHLAAGFSTDCLQCHDLTARTWGAGFDHSLTQFPLTGAHTQQQCRSCHANNVFSALSIACITCHQAAFNAAANPNHVSAGFPGLCQQCHTTAAWKPSTFDHSNTSFALAGAHLAVACVDCHVNGQYANLSSTCFSCHTTDFNQANNPNHVSAQFSQDCTLCHSTTAWQPASFDHATTRFSLTGKHVSATCEACHAGGNYQLVYADCYQCHQTEYAQSTVFNHVTANVSHDCATCHTTTAWLPSTFDHDGQYFRIYSGKHRDKWTSCLTCHTNAASYTEFTCFTCHEHDRPKMDDVHKDVPNYLYTSPSCYSCHRNA